MSTVFQDAISEGLKQAESAIHVKKNILEIVQDFCTELQNALNQKFPHQKIEVYQYNKSLIQKSDEDLDFQPYQDDFRKKVLSAAIYETCILVKLDDNDIESSKDFCIFRYMLNDSNGYPVRIKFRNQTIYADDALALEESMGRAFKSRSLALLEFLRNNSTDNQ